MNRYRVSIGALGLMLLFGATRGYGYVRSTIAQYEHLAPCGRLAGVPGLLQTAGFIPIGDCKLNSDGSCASAGSSCTISNRPSGSPTKGQCTNSISGKKKTCSCT